MEPTGSNEVEPVYGLFVSVAMLDCKMHSLQAKIACVKNDISRHDKVIGEKESDIVKLEKEIEDGSSKELKILANIDNLHLTKKFLEEMEIYTTHQLAVLNEKNEANKTAQKNLYEMYCNIANEYHDIYSTLPWVKEEHRLNIEILKKQILVNRLRHEYNEYLKKMSLFKIITDKRVQITIVAFIKFLVDRDKEKEILKKSLETEKKIKEEIQQLKISKKDLEEKIAQKAKDAVAEMRAKSVNPSRFTPAKAPIIRHNPIISIKERLGLKTFAAFPKPIELLPISFLKRNLIDDADSSDKKINETSTIRNIPVLETSGHETDDEAQLGSKVSPTGETLQISINLANNKNDILPKEMNVPDSSSLIKSVTIKPTEVCTQVLLPVNVSTTKDVETEKKKLPVKIQPQTSHKTLKKKKVTATTAFVSGGKLKQMKRGVKRGVGSTTKVEVRDMKKLRRVSFKSTVGTSISPEMKNPVSDSIPLAEIKNSSEQQSTGDVTLSDCTQLSVPDIDLDLSQSQDTYKNTSQVSLGAGNSQKFEFFEGFASPQLSITNESPTPATPQLSRYFSSPGFAVQDKRSQQFSEGCPGTVDNGLETYSFQVNQDTSAAVQMNLSPPFVHSLTSSGNQGLESFFGGPTSGGEKKSKNFFDLF